MPLPRHRSNPHRQPLQSSTHHQPPVPNLQLLGSPAAQQVHRHTHASTSRPRIIYKPRRGGAGAQQGRPLVGGSRGSRAGRGLGKARKIAGGGRKIAGKARGAGRVARAVTPRRLAARRRRPRGYATRPGPHPPLMETPFYPPLTPLAVHTYVRGVRFNYHAVIGAGMV